MTAGKHQIKKIENNGALVYVGSSLTVFCSQIGTEYIVLYCII